MNCCGNTNVVKITVEGMTCPHCVKSIKEGLLKVDGVAEVEVDLDSKEVEIIVESPVSKTAISDVIEELGYEVK